VVVTPEKLRMHGLGRAQMVPQLGTGARDHSEL
jgi:hypothetical protein